MYMKANVNKTGLSGFVWWLNHHFIILLPVMAEGKKVQNIFYYIFIEGPQPALLKFWALPWLTLLISLNDLVCDPRICKQLIWLSFQSNDTDHDEIKTYYSISHTKLTNRGSSSQFIVMWLGLNYKWQIMACKIQVVLTRNLEWCVLSSLFWKPDHSLVWETPGHVQSKENFRLLQVFWTKSIKRGEILRRVAIQCQLHYNKTNPNSALHEVLQ